MNKNEYIMPELTVVVISEKDILNGSDVLIDVSDLWQKN